MSSTSDLQIRTTANFASAVHEWDKYYVADCSGDYEREVTHGSLAHCMDWIEKNRNEKKC